jgi:hypothetical protein
VRLEGWNLRFAWGLILLASYPDSSLRTTKRYIYENVI